MSLLNRLFRGDEDNCQARYRRGRAHMKKRNWKQAVQELQIAAVLDPNNASVQLALGISHGALGQLEESIQAFRAALDLKDDMAQAHYNLSLVYEEKGELEQAICEAQEALRLGFEPAGDLIENLERHPLALMHVPELRKVVGELGIEDRSGMRKDELLEAIRLWRIEHSDAAPNPTAEPFPYHDTNGLLLRAICGELKTRGYSVGNYPQLKTSDLIVLLGKMVIEHNLDLMKFVEESLISEKARAKVEGYTLTELRRQAAKLKIRGRSYMKRPELVRAILLRTFSASDSKSAQSKAERERKKESQNPSGLQSSAANRLESRERPFIKDRVLGQGAFGTVYLAHDTLLDRPVAIKELTITAQADEVTIKRFLQEARAAGGLNHPNVVTIYTLEKKDANVSLVMEYVDGGSLRSLMEQRNPLAIEEAVRIAAEVCEGLAAAHAQGIIHRDIKPENILLTRDGRAKVGDFGIAHVPRGGAGTALTQVGFQPGTLLYMSPEQIRGEPVDGRSDVYQVGVLLYEMLTGRHYVDIDRLGEQARESAGSNAMLFQARLYELMAEAICQRAVLDVHQWRPEVPDWLAEALAASMAKRREKRPTMAELVQALRDRVEPVTPTHGSALSRQETQRAKKQKPRDLPESQRLEGEPIRPENANQTSVGPGSADEKNVHYYGKRLTLKRAPMARYPGEDPPMIVSVTYLNLLCPLGKLEERVGRVETCHSAIQLVVDLAPCAVLCPSCLGLLFIDHSSNTPRYPDADIKWALNNGTVLVGYATYPDHAAQGALHDKIARFTDGGRALVAMRLDDEVVEMLGIAEGQITTIPSSCGEEELSSMLPSPSALADHISKLALEAYQQGRFWETVTLAQRALVIEPKWALAHFFLGSALDELGMLERAVEAYQAALRFQPRFLEAHLNLGLVYERQERWADAISQYQAVLCINPNFAKAHYNLGVAYGQLGRTDEEIREYQAALRIEPNYAEAHCNLGVVYWQQGKLDEAISEFQTTLRINPNNAMAHCNLGVAYGQLGRLDEAIQEAQTALALGFEPARQLLISLRNE